MEDALVDILDANRINQRMETERFQKRWHSTYVPFHSVTSHEKAILQSPLWENKTLINDIYVI